MRIGSLLTVFTLLLLASCTRETIFTLSNERGGSVIVAEDLETMRKIIEAGATRRYQDLPLIDLMAAKKVFLVRSGTKVEVAEAHVFGRNAKVHILEGEYTGRLGWVHKSMLH